MPEERSMLVCFRCRPLGVWLLTICNAGYATLLLADSVYIRFLEDAHYFASAPRWVELVLICVCLAAVGTWFGSRYARTVFLVGLVALACLMIVENALTIQFALAQRHDDDKPWSLRTWWALSMGLRWLSWLALNCWYFLGPRTRDFFSAKGGHLTHA